MTATGRKWFPSVSKETVRRSSAHLGLAGKIIKKYQRAMENDANSREYFNQLSAAATEEQLVAWETEISKAEDKRASEPESMDCMAPKVPKGRPTLRSFGPY
jgi:hypothetical protein